MKHFNKQFTTNYLYSTKYIKKYFKEVINYLIEEEDFLTMGDDLNAMDIREIIKDKAKEMGLIK